MIDLKDKKILVTGGGGFLGTYVVKKLLSRGVPKENIFVPRSQEFDLRERKNCEKAVRKQDIVIHCAGITGNPLFHREHPAEIFYDNLVMGVELMDAARIGGVQKFVAIGSATEYPENVPLPYREDNIWLGPPELLHAPHTTAKKTLLVQGQAYRKQYGMNVIHLLPTNMYGPGERDDFVIPMFIKKIKEAKNNGRNFIEVWGTGQQTRDFLYIEDVAEGIVLATEKYDKAEPVNLGSGFETSIKELAELIMRLMDFRGEIHFNVEKFGGEMRRLLDTNFAEKEIGFKAVVDLEMGLKETIKFHGA